MESLLAWQSIIFLVPLALGCCMVGGMTLGFGADSHGGHDLHPHLHLHFHHGHAGLRGGGSEEPSLLSFLGLGRVPLVLLLIISAFIFGATGLAANEFLRGAFPGAYGFVSLATATAASLLGTGQVARLIAKLAPMSNSSNAELTEEYMPILLARIAACERGLWTPAGGAVKAPKSDARQISLF